MVTFHTAHEMLNASQGSTAREILAALKLPRGVRRAHGISIHATRDTLAPSYARDCAMFELSYTQEKGYQSRGDYAKLARVTCEVPGRITTGNTDARELRTTSFKRYEYTEAFEPATGFWSLFGAEERLFDALECVSPLALINIGVHLDHGTTSIHAEHLLHSDALILTATEPSKRGESRVRHFLLDTTTGYHNTARFGSPGSEL